MQIPILPVQSSNNSPAPQAKANGPAGTADHDFQRTLTRQIEQRQALKNASQHQLRGSAPAPAAAKPAQPAAVASQPLQQTDAKPADHEPPAAKPADSSQAAPADGPAAPADKTAKADSDKTEETAAVADPAADMLALVASMKQAIGQPAAPAAEAAAQETGAGLQAGKTGPALTEARSVKARPGVLPAADASNTAKTAAADFAASVDAAQAKTGQGALDGGAAPQTKSEAGKLQLDPAQLSALKAKEALPEQLATVKEPLIDAAKVVAPVQQASLHIAAAAASIPADQLNGRVGSPAWDQQLGQKIVWMAAGGDQSATLTLNPPDLGPLQVVLKVTNEQTDAAFTSSQPEVRQALEAALPKLREMMSEAGLQFGNATVSAGTQQQQNQAESQARMARDGGNGNGRSSGGDGAVDSQIRVTPASRGVSQGMVDTFA